MITANNNPTDPFAKGSFWVYLDDEAKEVVLGFNHHGPEPGVGEALERVPCSLLDEKGYEVVMRPTVDRWLRVLRVRRFVRNLEELHWGQQLG